MTLFTPVYIKVTRDYLHMDGATGSKVNELRALDEIEALQSEIERLCVELQSKAIIIENQRGTINNQAEKILVALKGR